MCARPISPPSAFFRLDRIVSAARDIEVSDYFDRLALDRALDSIGDAERRLTAEMVDDGAGRTPAVEAWVAPRKAEVDRIRTSVHEIANSGPDAVEALGGGEPAGRSGQAISADARRREVVIRARAIDAVLRGSFAALNAGNAACR